MDWAEWLACEEPDSAASTEGDKAKGAPDKRLNERDRWFVEQRPPHWD